MVMNWENKRVRIRSSSKLQRRRAVLVALFALLMISIGGLWAYFTDSQTVSNAFTVVKSLKISIEEPAWDVSDEDGNGIPDASQNVTPTKEIKKDPRIKNESDTAVWMIAQVKVPYGTVATATDEGVRLEESPQQLFEWALEEGWTEPQEPQLVDDGAAMLHTYLAVRPVGVQQSTPPIFTKVRLINLIEGSFSGPCSIDITGCAIQAAGFETPEDAWSAYQSQNA